MALVEIRGVDFSFSRDKPLFKNLSLTLGPESPAVILGPSGCGKTTLLRLLAGLLEPQRGDIVIHDADPALGCAVSMVFQEPRLLPWKTVLENVSLPLMEKWGKRDATERALHFLALVSLADKAAALPRELSGGQRQRVNLARAFAFPGEILLMDEPFQSLDIPLRIELMEESLSLLEEFKRLCVCVTHDPREAVYMGNRILVMGESPQGLMYDEPVFLSREDRRYGSQAQGKMEQTLLGFLREGAEKNDPSEKKDTKL